MCVALQQAGDQADHIQPGVAHRGVQHPPGCLYDISLWAESKEVSPHKRKRFERSQRLPMMRNTHFHSEALFKIQQSWHSSTNLRSLIRRVEGSFVKTGFLNHLELPNSEPLEGPGAAGESL